MQCKKCGAELLQNAKFCVKCGSDVINEKKKNIWPALIGVMASVILLATIFCVMGGILHPMILVWAVVAGLVLLNIGIVWKVNKKHVVVSGEGELSSNEVNMLSHIFVSKDEQYIASIGNGYIVNFLLGKGLHKGFAVLSDKRVYFKGKCMSVSGKKLAATNEERTVDIANVTGSGFIYKRSFFQRSILIEVLPTILLLSFVLLYMVLGSGLSGALSQGSYGIYNAIIRELMVGLPLVMLIIVLLIHYFISRRTYFRIEYAGGGIAFDVSLYAKKEIDKFQKLLRQTKDSVENAVALPKESLGTVSPIVINDVAVELRKYMDMVNEGLISQEEYDAIKKKILGI